MKKYYKHKIENLLSIKSIITIEYLELSKKYHFNTEKHNFWELVYVDKGKIIYDINNNRIIMHEGEILFLKPNQLHSINTDGKTAPSIFVICFDCISSIMNYFDGYKEAADDNIKKLLSLIIDETLQTFKMPFKNKLIATENPNLGGQQVIRILLEYLLISLLRLDLKKDTNMAVFLNDASFSEEIANIIIEYLKENIYNRLKINDICKKINYSKSYICQTFKKSTGISIIEYYNKLKISEAKRLIRENENYTFAYISELLNFSDPRYFSVLFKKLTKKTPTQYKNSIIQ